MSREIVTRVDLYQVAREAADRFTALAHESIAARGRFAVALSGGATPRALFWLLASAEYRDRIEWRWLLVFWSDERCVPRDHPDSNYGAARELLLSRVPIPAGSVHRMRGEIDPEQAALEYEQLIEREVGTPADGVPVFDLVFLGLGPDGHTASLFPGTAALHDRTRLVAANFVPKLSTFRITFTPRLINASARVIFLVTGPDKAAALRAVLEGEFNPDVLPAQLIRPAGGAVTWLIDETAGRHLRAL